MQTQCNQAAWPSVSDIWVAANENMVPARMSVQTQCRELVPMHAVVCTYPRPAARSCSIGSESGVVVQTPIFEDSEVSLPGYAVNVLHRVNRLVSCFDVATCIAPNLMASEFTSERNLKKIVICVRKARKPAFAIPLVRDSQDGVVILFRFSLLSTAPKRA
jgi:hypothetical protein